MTFRLRRTIGGWIGIAGFSSVASAIDCKIGEPTTVLIASRVFAEIGLFDSGLSQYVDLDMWWRIMGNYHIGFVDEKLSSLRIHPEQQTWKNFAEFSNLIFAE